MHIARDDGGFFGHFGGWFGSSGYNQPPPPPGRQPARGVSYYPYRDSGADGAISEPSVFASNQTLTPAPRNYPPPARASDRAARDRAVADDKALRAVPLSAWPPRRDKSPALRAGVGVWPPWYGRSILFQATFRFLAAKILSDRGHAASARWSDGTINSVLCGIEEYYGFEAVRIGRNRDRSLLENVWARLRAGINFRNISADDLAFVYENTFVTSDVRANLGTHSTPRQMAELIVRSLELWRDPKNTHIYEPFTGAGVFLVAALRQLRSALPLDWSDEQRHVFLTERLAGDELDAFACEVAKLSLILADYPNHNGWDIQQTDLFTNSRLVPAIHNTFVLCNPPCKIYPQMAGSAGSSLFHDQPRRNSVLRHSLLVWDPFYRQRFR